MQTIKQVFPWIVGAIFALAIYIWNYGLWPQYFDIAWDEEVRLHDGRVILLHVNRTYERQGRRLERWSGIQSSMEISFETETSKGKFSHKFERGHLVFLDQKNGKWYIGYYAGSVNPSTDIGNRSIYPHVAVLESNGIISKPVSWNDIPRSIVELNIMPPTPDSNGVTKFNGTVLKLETKYQHWVEFPTGPGAHSITRITEEPVQKEVR